MTDNNPFENQSDNKNYLEELVGEGKKFKTTEDLAKSKYQTDDYLEVLKAELATTKAELQNKMSLEDFYQKIKTPAVDNSSGDPLQRLENDNLSPAPDVEKTVLETLKRLESENSIKKNEEIVVQKLNEVFGNDTVKILEEKAKELGVSVKYLQDIARQSPVSFFKLTDLDKDRSAPSGTAVPQGTVNLPRDTNSGLRDAKYYRELKRTNPKLYRDPKTQVQIQLDAIALGEKYFN